MDNILSKKRISLLKLRTLLTLIFITSHMRRLKLATLVNKLDTRFWLASKMKEPILNIKENLYLIEQVFVWFPVRIACVARSLTIYSILNQQNYPVEICVGITPPPCFESHMWVSMNGVTVAQHPFTQVKYTVIWKYPS